MAVWAFYMAIFAGVSTFVTFIGTILIWRQVSLTREAVEDTGKATAAMVRANQISEMSQLRSYVGPHLTYINVAPGQSVTAKFTFQNSGASPARNVFFCATFTIEGTEESLSFINIGIIKCRSLSAIPPNGQRVGGMPINIQAKNAIRDTLAKGSWLCVRGYIYWLAANDRHYRTDYVFRTRNFKAQDNKIMLNPVHCNAPTYQEVDEHGKPIGPAKS